MDLKECEICLKLGVADCCSQRKNSYYCSDDHQRKHWYIHKWECNLSSSSSTSIPPDLIGLQTPLTDLELHYLSRRVGPNGLATYCRVNPFIDAEFLKQKVITLEHLNGPDARSNIIFIAQLRNFAFRNSTTSRCYEAVTKNCRYLKPYYRISSIIVDFAKQGIRSIPGVWKYLFKIYILFYASKNLPQSESLSIDEKMEHIDNDLQNLALTLLSVQKIKSLLDAYESTKGRDKVWKFFVSKMMENTVLLASKAEILHKQGHPDKMIPDTNKSVENYKIWCKENNYPFPSDFPACLRVDF